MAIAMLESIPLNDGERERILNLRPEQVNFRDLIRSLIVHSALSLCLSPPRVCREVIFSWEHTKIEMFSPRQKVKKWLHIRTERKL